MLALLLATAFADPRISVVALPPATRDVDARALSSIVAGALHDAAEQRGWRAVSVERTRPVAEALARCTTQRCRMNSAKRLGAKFAIELRERDALVIVDVGSEAALAEVVLEGADRPQVHANAAHATSALLEKIAPKAQHARERATYAAFELERRGDLDAALRKIIEAIDAAPLDDDAADLWLLRARLFRDTQRADEQWDLLIDAIGPQAKTRFSTETRAHVDAAIRDHLMTRASRSADDEEAASMWEKIGALFDDDDARFTALRLRAKARSSQSSL